MGLFNNIWSAIKGFFQKEVPVLEDALSKSNGIVNIIKSFLGSHTGQTIITILEAFIPGPVTAILTALNTFFTDFGLVTTEASKPLEQMVADGLNALSKLSGDNKAIALSNIAAIIGNAIDTVNGGTSTIQQHLIANVVVHNPDVLNTGDVVAAPVAAQATA